MPVTTLTLLFHHHKDVLTFVKIHHTWLVPASGLFVLMKKIKEIIRYVNATNLNKKYNHVIFLISARDNVRQREILNATTTLDVQLINLVLI